MFTNLTRCYIIAEIGGNFTTIEQAAALIAAAKESGVDCVKLQTYSAETIVSGTAMFDMESTGKILQKDYFRRYEISRELHEKVITCSEQAGLDWFSTPSHETDLEMLLELGMKAIKIGADDANNLPFLVNCARTGLPIILSTGMCTLAEVREAVDTILRCGNPHVIILHTVSGYPTYPQDVNLRVLETYRREFPGMYVGFSDHSLTPLACIAAATMGANVVERHFTLDKTSEGPDHQISATPDEMKYIVESIRSIEIMRGSSVKMPYGPEVKNRLNNRKSLHVIKSVLKDELFSPENIGIRRPGTGIEPKQLHKILGRSAARNIDTDEILGWTDIK
ncbi:MAG: N-acetylneuraminate synthase family protein [Chitinophagaceae bacterium]|nr:N-acetylneuraminate synthase family protein [Chitinophagaceae bacterium]